MPKRTTSERKGRPGRPKGKPLSAKERAQRRAAAVKTGQHATSALAQALPPCKPAVCPNDGKGTCDLKRAVEARGAGLSACLVSLGHQDTMQKYLAAIERGDLNGLAELAATSMAGQLALAQGELATLLHEGLVVQVPVVGRNADGDLEVVAERPIENPRAANTFQLLRQLGHTATDQAITPKSSGERERDQGLGLAGRAAWVSQMRKGLAGEGEDSDA
ncbi:MAG TPA: hypothetical protein VFR31_20455 [Thermoanaerobaculia bacterium]|nr:hypothetical protein [Thermoanaerobaculia bacterium]